MCKERLLAVNMLRGALGGLSDLFLVEAIVKAGVTVRRVEVVTYKDLKMK